MSHPRIEEFRSDRRHQPSALWEWLGGKPRREPQCTAERGHLLCTPTAVSKGDVKPSWLIIVDGENTVIEGTRSVPSPSCSCIDRAVRGSTRHLRGDSCPSAGQLCVCGRG